LINEDESIYLKIMKVKMIKNKTPVIEAGVSRKKYVFR